MDGEVIENDKKTIVWTENILFVFKFIRISVDGEIIENDKKTIVWTENILTFSNLSGLVWTGLFSQCSKGTNYSYSENKRA